MIEKRFENIDNRTSLRPDNLPVVQYVFLPIKLAEYRHSMEPTEITIVNGVSMAFYDFLLAIKKNAASTMFYLFKGTKFLSKKM